MFIFVKNILTPMHILFRSLLFEDFLMLLFFFFFANVDMRGHRNLSGLTKKTFFSLIMINQLP